MEHASSALESAWIFSARRFPAIALLALAGSLTACGSGGGGDSGALSPSASATEAGFVLQVNRVGSGVVTSPSGIDCGTDCSETLSTGTPVTLTAVAAAGFSFSGWSGNGVTCPGTGTCTATMDAARTVTATFSNNLAVTATLVVNLAGSGSVTSNPAGISCGADCSETYAINTPVVLTAAAAGGFNFTGWSASGASCPGTGACAVTMSVARTVNASFAAVAAPADLCAGLITDKLDHPMTALANPALGVAVTDPAFGTTIRRISDVGAGQIVPAYSTIPAWNADESRLILYHTGGAANAGHNLYHGKTYARIEKLNIDPPDLEQFYWHTTDPDILYYVSSKTLIRYHVSTRVKNSVRTFACAGTLGGGSDPMFMSWDSDVIGLRCDTSVFTYRISTDTEGTRVVIAGSNAPIASASGALAFLANGTAANVRDANTMGFLRGLPIRPAEHASLGRLANGTDTHNSVGFDPGNGGNFIGSLVTVDMTNAAARVIIGQATGYPYPPGGTHVSTLAFKNPGWVALSIVGNTNGQTLLNQELVLADTKTGGKICRVGHHRSSGTPYFAEPHVVISPSGTRLLFGSNWGGGAVVNAYVVELPGYVP